MTHVRVQLQPAYVLHRRNYRESSLLVELYTAEYGRIGSVARGARKSGARLQPFVPLLVSWSGRGELASLGGVEAVGPASWLRGNALVAGLYVNELMLRLLPRDVPHPDLYPAYQRVLEALAALGAPLGGEAEWALRVFEKRLLEETGYGLQLACDAESGESLVAEREYEYLLERGPVAVAGKVETGALVLHGRTLLALESGRWDDAIALNEVKRLMRAALAAQMGDRPVHSRRLFV